MRIYLPKQASIQWPVVPHNPYTKDGHAEPKEGRIVITLPFSKLVVSVATLLEVGVSEDDDRSTVEPDVDATLTYADWAAQRDPALEAIAALPEN